MAGDYNKKRRPTPSSGGSEPIASLRELPDELVWEIISRLGTLNQVVRCSSLLSKRWRNAWRSIDGGVLDLDKSDEMQLRLLQTKTQRGRFAKMVDQALASLADHQTLDALRIGFDLSTMATQARRWIEFGLTKQAKEITVISTSPLSLRRRNNNNAPLLPPHFLAATTTYNVSFLQILQLHGIWRNPPTTISYILDTCPSLRRFSLRNCTFSGTGTVVVVNIAYSRCNHRRRHSLSLDFQVPHTVVRIKLASAPNLATLKLDLAPGSRVEFGDHLPRLREALFVGEWTRESSTRLPWSSSSSAQFDKFSVDRLGLQLVPNHFRPRPASSSGWWLFEKISELDLEMFIDTCSFPSSLLHCTVLLKAAPALRRLSVGFLNAENRRKRSTDLRSPPVAESSSGKHHSLEVLRLRGVHGIGAFVASARRIQLELAACIIRNAPSLKEVLVDTRHQSLIGSPTARFPHQVDEDVCEVKMELESRLQGCSVSPGVQFTYR